MSELVIKNRMTASQLVRANGGSLDFVENPHTNKLFFVCGSVRGYVSKNVRDNMDTVTLDQLQYGEIEANINGKPTSVPTLFMANVANVKKHFEL